MAICSQAEDLAQRLNVQLNQQSRTKLSTYSNKDQCRWIANPRVMSFIERIHHQIMTGRRVVSKKTTVTKPSTPLPDPIEDPSSDSDDGEGMLSLFDD